MAKLKVYRTPIGFHDAYVAAPSQAAALKAWGSDRNLFARGVAEMVTDPALTKAPLADPGAVIKVSRGTAAEQMAALPARKPAAKSRVSAGDKSAAEKNEAPKPKAKPKPKPSRAKLDAAERALDNAAAEQDAEREAIAREEADLATRKRAVRERQAQAMAALEERREAARDAYDRAIADWQD